MEPKIVCDPEICGGVPTIRGTRIPAHIILELLAAGKSHEYIMDQYPGVTEEDIRACCRLHALPRGDRAMKRSC